MSNALQINGAQSEKQVKFAPMYVGRIFSGIWTNRSPLRDADTNRVQEKYYGPAGDAMIAGSNVEVTNRLTLSRRPGCPQYDSVNEYTDVLAMDEFRYSKALSDVWGTSTEQIDVMVDTAAALYANNSGNSTEVLAKSAGSGQSFMQEVGTQLYFGDGIDQKKWNQSLFTRKTANNSLGLNTNAYGFMNTNLIDSNGNIQQLIGTLIATINTVAISANVLTITLDKKLGDATQFPGPMFDNPGGIQAKGTQFMLWGFQGTAADFLNGATVALSTTTLANAVSLTFDFTHDTLASTSVTGYLQTESGLVSGVANSLLSAVAITAIMPAAVTLSAPGLTMGSTVPTYGSTVPSSSNNFQGSITIDGNSIWVNRGIPTQNWGLVAPTVVPVVQPNGSVSGYVPDTYFSPASIYQDTVSGYLWQISTPGIVGSGTAPSGGWPASPSVALKTSVVSLAITSSTSTIVVTVPYATPLTGTVTMLGLEPASFLNGVPLLITSSTHTTFTATYAYPVDYSVTIQSAGYVFSGGTTVADGAAIWTCIQTPTLTNAWQADYTYTPGTYIKAPNGPGGAPAFWLLRTNQGTSGIGQPTINVAGSPVMYGYTSRGTNGNVSLTYPATSPGETFDFASGGSAGHVASLLFYYDHFSDAYLYCTPISGAAIVGASYEVEAATPSWTFAAVYPITIPTAGTYTFSMQHNGGGMYAFKPTNGAGGSCTRTTGSFSPSAGQTTTIYGGYPTPCGTNNYASASLAAALANDISSWTFTAPGVYLLEIDWIAAQTGTANNMSFLCNGLNLAIEPTVSGATAPPWSVFLPAGIGATYNGVTDEIYFAQTASDSNGQYVWNNIGLVSTFDRTSMVGIYYTLPGTPIVDTFSDEEGAYATGSTGTTAPAWSTTPNTVVLDPNTPLSWINEGAVPIPATAAGKITATSAQGWIWALALVNTLDNTVSNIGPLSVQSGPLVNAAPTFAPGSGLATSEIDPQADYVAIFRTADGQPLELLLAGFGNTIYTVPLNQYLLNGYIDTTPDVDLDTSAVAPAAYENTPPLPGAVNLVYHLNRLFYSIGNTVFYTSGPLDPVGNGINGFGPNNYDIMPSTVKRLVPTAIGLLVFTVSDIYKIPDNNGVILPSVIWVGGIGISSYNALDYNGPSIGFFTTDSQFLTLTPNAGMSTASVPIADQLVLNNATPGQDWNPANVYVAHYVNGPDMGWFVSDGTYGWFRLISNAAPESGSMSWSPFATIQGGVGAIKAVEVSPGAHRLLLAPTGVGYIMNRDVLATTDNGTTGSNGTPYPAYAVFGSYVLAQPGQVAQVAFVTTKSVAVGSPLVLGLLIDEALPYYKGSFEILKNCTNDPPTLKPSKSWYTQRFYLSDMPDEAAACTDMQIMVQWPAEAALNELQTFTIFGCYVQEE
jgi:hypothetical protein